MTHESHFNGDTLTLTSPRGSIVLSQGQCASIVIMAEKHGPVGRVRDAHCPGRECTIDAMVRATDNLAYKDVPDQVARAILDAIHAGNVPGIYGEEAWQNQVRAERLMRDACAEEIAALRAKLDEAERSSEQRLKTANEAYNAKWDEISAERDRLAAQVRDLNASYIQSREARATHRCKVCDAKWIQLTGGPLWTLASAKCGKCCDNVAMGEQIEPVGLTARVAELERDVSAWKSNFRLCADTGEQHRLERDKALADLAAKRERRLVIMRRVGERYEHLRQELIAARAESAQWKEQAEKAETKAAAACNVMVAGGIAIEPALIAEAKRCEDAARAEADAMAGLLREIRDSHHDNTAGGCPGAGDRFADAINRIDAVLAKVVKP